MTQALLGAENAGNLGLGIQRHPIAPLIPLGHCLQQLRQIHNGIEIVLGLQRFLTEHLGNMRCGRNVGRADGEINHLLAPSLYRSAAIFHDGKNGLAKSIHAF